MQCNPGRTKTGVCTVCNEEWCGIHPWCNNPKCTHDGICNNGFGPDRCEFKASECRVHCRCHAEIKTKSNSDCSCGPTTTKKCINCNACAFFIEGKGYCGEHECANKLHSFCLKERRKGHVHGFSFADDGSGNVVCIRCWRFAKECLLEGGYSRYTDEEQMFDSEEDSY